MTYQVNVDLNVTPCVKVQLLKTPMLKATRLGVFEYYFVFTPYLGI